MSVPRQIALVDLSGALPAAIDTFVCCASYEQRSLSIPLHVNPEQVKRLSSASTMILRQALERTIVRY